MQIEIKELEPCKLAVTYVADAGEIFEKRGVVLDYFRKAPVPGYRQGKATIDAIKMHYRNQIEESLKRALAEDAYHNTVFEKKLRPHGSPQFTSALMGDGKFTCEFNLSTKPDFELAPYKNLEVPKPHLDTNVTELTEKMIQELRVRFGDVTPYVPGDFVQDGDNVILDYEGAINGEKVDSLCAEGEMLTIGKSQLVDFDSNLLGMTLGDTREFSMVVPMTGLPSLTGKTISFKVTLTMGSKTTPHPLNDDLAKKVGKETYDEFRAFVHSAALGKLATTDRSQLIEAVAAKMVSDNSFDVPNWLSLSEAQYLAHNAKIDWATLQDVDREKYLEMAAKNVKLSLILDKIREVEPDAQLSDQEVFDVIKQNIAKSQVKTPVDEVIKQMNSTGYLQILFSRIRDEHTLDYIVKTTKVTE